MRRRDFLTGSGAAALSACSTMRSGSEGKTGSADALIAATNEKAIAQFPFERVVVRGEDALSTWRQLKEAGRGAPVVLGGDDVFPNLVAPFDPALGDTRSVPDIVEAADRIAHPTDLALLHKASEERAHRELRDRLSRDPNADLGINIVQRNKDGVYRPLSREETAAFLLKDRVEPATGELPYFASKSPGLSVARGASTGKPLPKVHIALIPTDDWTTIPAHLKWGGWNECPKPEYHVAALRQWRDRYGADLAGLGFDTMNLFVARRPATQAQAIALAREQYVYCPDIVDQGVGTYGQLAKDLMENPWWYFWWD